MDRGQSRDLTVDEAKQRLVEAAAGISLRSWTRRHPWETAFGAFLFGFMAGNGAESRRVVRDALTLFSRFL